MKSNPINMASTNTNKKDDAAKKISIKKTPTLSPHENYACALTLLAELQTNNQDSPSQLQINFFLMLQYLCAAATCYWQEDNTDDEDNKDAKSTPTQDQKAAKDALSEFKKIYYIIKKEACTWEKLPLNFKVTNFLESNQKSIATYLQEKPWSKTNNTAVSTLTSTATPSSLSASTVSTTVSGFDTLTDDDFIEYPTGPQLSSVKI
jgi:hypothetical protein